jgi:hypothetical protein
MNSKERATKQLASIEAKWGYAKGCDHDPLYLHVNWQGEHCEFSSYAEVLRWVAQIKKVGAQAPER